jgi:PAS domain S-box-containing protein
MDKAAGKSGDSPAAEASAAAGRSLWLPLSMLGTLIVLANVILANYTYQQKLADHWTMVEAVAELRGQQVSSWLEERLSSASLHATSFPQAELYTRWQTLGDLEARDQLFLRLNQFAAAGRFSSVTLLNSDGRFLGGREHVPRVVPPDLLERWLQPATGSPAWFIGPYVDVDGASHLDFLSTLPVDDPLGPPIVMLHTSSSEYFPRELQQFPLPGTPGEVVLFRIEDGAIVVLDDLWHLQGSAFEPFALDEFPELPAARLVAAGAEDMTRVDGVDYRGVAAFAAGRRLPGTDWYLLAKQDFAEVRKATVLAMLWISMLSALLFAAIAAFLAHLRERRQLRAFEAARRAEDERVQALQLLKAIADSATEAIFVKDLEGRYLMANRATSELTGKSEEQLLGLVDTSLFPPEQARMLSEIDRRALEENRAIMSRASLDTASGPRTILATKGPLHDEQGKLIGIYGIARDVTELERSSELLEQHGRHLEQRNEELERFNEAMVGRELDMLRLKRQVNDLSLRLGLEAPYGRQLIELPEDD